MAGPVRVVHEQIGAGAELKHGVDRLYKQFHQNLGEPDSLTVANVKAGLK
jgi:hypothetical protein